MESSKNNTEQNWFVINMLFLADFFLFFWAGGLRAEKVASAAALKKQEVRLAHLESLVTQLTQQVLKNKPQGSLGPCSFQLLSDPLIVCTLGSFI